MSLIIFCSILKSMIFRNLKTFNPARQDNSLVKIKIYYSFTITDWLHETSTLITPTAYLQTRHFNIQTELKTKQSTRKLLQLQTEIRQSTFLQTYIFNTSSCKQTPHQYKSITNMALTIPARTVTLTQSSSCIGQPLGALPSLWMAIGLRSLGPGWAVPYT